MKSSAIENISKLYQSYTNLYQIKFDNRYLATISSKISKLLSSLGDLRELAFWPELSSALKRFRFDLTTTPLPFSSAELLSEKLRSSLKTALNFASQFPEQIQLINEINDLINNLPSEEHPFMTWVKSMMLNREVNDSFAICLPNAKNVFIVEEFFRQSEDLFDSKCEILNPRQLKELRFYDLIVFCGSIKLFSENPFADYEYVWRSPRARNLYFLSFSWIKGEFKPTPSFDVKPNCIALKEFDEYIPDPGYKYVSDDDIFESTPISFDDYNFSPVSILVTKSNVLPKNDYSSVSDCECRIVSLDDGCYLYKDIESYSHIVNFQPETEVNKISNRQLEPGMPLIVRTEGSNDSIAAVADMLLGERAELVRMLQNEWKIAFRRKLFSYEYLSDVQSELIKLGSLIANESNIRNWSKDETIKPKDYRDFEAIMKFSGISERAEVYWNNAKSIFKMHVQAGREISKLLRSKITAASMNEFVKYGKIEVDLPDIAGKLSVIHIEAISNTKYIISSNSVNKLMYS
ncbi:hypothetical protein [Desulfobacula sp.]|uniref:DISARM anti-phage system protein DrmE domain-containing protein n=1 Tax=Desulfobacula sp. TaxID=2593537 RepID=UPI0025B9ECC9|nr:hypothetical protein [Desulfobacula sp.]MBC2705603.1 hypothetical protein [Desulfobacula sp.]